MTQSHGAVFTFLGAGFLVLLSGCVSESFEDDGSSAELVDEAEQAVALCRGTTCNGKDPRAMGCETGATTKASGELRDEMSGILYGYVQMRYSSTCDAKWGRVYSNGSLPWSKIALRGSSGSPTYYSPVWSSNETYIWTTMRSSAGGLLRVDGVIDCTGPTGIPCDSADYNYVYW